MASIVLDGEGTETLPYLCHSYEELRAIADNIKDELGAKGTYYARLENDIDCKAMYGNSFEWEGVELYYSESNVILDLNNKTIKNAMISNQGCLFKVKRCIRGGVGYSTELKNGNILNIFNNNGKAVVYVDSTITNYISCIIDNVSFSCEGTGLTDGGFMKVQCTNCSFYYKAANVASNFHIFVTSNNQFDFRNCDFWFDISCKSKSSSFEPFKNGYKQRNLIDGCRIRGEVKNSYVMLVGLSNSVVNLKFDTTGQYNSTIIDLCDGIINTDIITGPDWLNNNMIKVSTAEIESKDENVLSSKGFVVVKE